MSRSSSKTTVAPASGSGSLDLLGELPVTREDVYFWLLAVVNLDPADRRADHYVRTYSVVSKIRRAKEDGSFAEIVLPAGHAARMRELKQAGVASVYPPHPLGLGTIEETKVGLPMVGRPLRAKNRPREVIRRESKRKRKESSTRALLKGSLLNLLPQATPSLSVMLADLGRPHPAVIAAALGVAASTAKRWIEQDMAPRPVMLALYSITRWGVSAVEARAHNDAVAAAIRANALRSEVEQLERTLHKVGQIADFGSANDPLPQLPSRQKPPASQPEKSSHDQLSRRAACAESSPKKKRA